MLELRGEVNDAAIIYLASPYGQGIVAGMTKMDAALIRERRFMAVLRVATALTGLGLNVYSPIVHNHPINSQFRNDGQIDMTCWNHWEWRDMSMLKRCDELYVLTLDGWKESVGVQAEIKFAQKLKLPLWFIGPGDNDAALAKYGYKN